MRTVAVFAGMLVVVVGCASPRVVQQQRQHFVETIPTCATDRECELKWSAARQWVLGHSDTKLQHLTADFMDTYNSTNTAAPSYRVVKDPMLDGGYRLLITVGCRNPFGCIPDPWAAAQHFNNYVNSVPAPAPSSAAPAPASGVKPAPDWCRAANLQWLGDRCVERK